MYVCTVSLGIVQWKELCKLHYRISEASLAQLFVTYNIKQYNTLYHTQTNEWVGFIYEYMFKLSR